MYRINTGTVECLVGYNITYQPLNILPLPCLYGMFCDVFVVLYTHSLVLLLQYHISTTKHSTVPLFNEHKLMYRINKGTVECLGVDM
jgi:hypothetical protein